ncbi:MAG: hypothetical protein D6786_10060 [Gammaproteobacteria bacterium]|nr:MAG: hypothetical protein D6786_10060 [Gammaproteobacteria bacterium]
MSLTSAPTFPHIMPRRLLIPLLILLALLLAACAPAVKPPPAGPSAEELAARRLESGDFAGAARDFLELARGSSGEAATRYRLFAAEALLRSGDTGAAGVLLDEIRTKVPVLQAWQALLQAMLAQQRQQPGKVATLLAGIDPQLLPSRLLPDLYRLQARSFEASGNGLEAARARVRLDALLGPEEQQANRLAVWEALNRYNSQVLEGLRPDPDPVLDGWIELSVLARRESGSALRLRQALADWSSRHPGHPAAETILPQLEQMVQALDIQVAQLAVLLPLSGRLATAAQAIRDGMVMAWFEAPEGERPVMRFYDTTTRGAVDAYQQAAADGADAVVGPLAKEEVERLAGLEQLPLLTLALNQVPGAASGRRDQPLRLAQFGLVPEDEAAQAAERAWFDGHLRGLVLVPEGEWGQRVLQAFRGRLVELGGELVDFRAYDPEQRDLGPPVKALLGIDEAEHRRAALQRLIGERLHFEPRRRQDADFVFLAARHIPARQLIPQLRFHHAEDLPVYATSHLFRPGMDSEAARDLEGVIFGDMPWLIDPRSRDRTLYALISNAWPRRALSQGRLFALGIDAFRLLPRLGRLHVSATARFEGQTGMLYMDEGGRIHRLLSWARLEEGEPVLLDQPQR